MAKGRLLIVEDDPDLAENLVEILQGLDWDVSVAGTAEDALPILEREAYSGVITDFRLPGLGGIDLIAKLRDRGIAVPVIVMSAFMDAAAAERAERVAAFEALQKPVNLERLFTLLKAFISPSREVLIVEDNEALAENVADALREEGLDVDVRPSGSEALSKRSLPRVALVDLRLPDLSGVEVARRLCARDPNLRILFVTAYPEEAGERLSAIGSALPWLDPEHPCLLKPFDLLELVERVRRTVTPDAP